jgi:hypothetical protein
MAEKGMVEILIEDHEELVNDQMFLQALHAAGVDNWDGYSDAQEFLVTTEEI